MTTRTHYCHLKVMWLELGTNRLLYCYQVISNQEMNNWCLEQTVMRFIIVFNYLGGNNILPHVCTHTHSSHHTLFTHTHTQRGLTSLHDVCVEGHTRIALLLLAMGAFLMARTKDGWTCLMCAASNGHLQLAQILIAAGCDINSSTKVLELFEQNYSRLFHWLFCVSVFLSFPPDWTNSTSHSSMEGPC